MAANIYDLSTTAASNTTIDGVDVSGSTGKVKDGDNVMRSLGAYMAQVLDDLGGVATTAGTANAQTVTLASGFTAYATGNLFTVKIGSGLTNTSSTVTMAVNSISGAKTVKVNYGGVLANPIPGDLQAGAYATFLYDGTYLVLLTAQQQARYPDGHIKGLTLSNNGSDATNDIDIAIGNARSSDDVANIDLASALTKQLDTAWAVGSGNGGLDTGTVGNSRYYGWIIKRPDTGVVDFLFSLSATSPTMPTNYTLKRRVGSVLRTGGVNGTPDQRDDLSSTVLTASAVSLTTATAANVTSLPLVGPGFFDVSGTVAFTLNGATTLAAIVGWISTTSATLPTQPNGGMEFISNGPFTTGGGIQVPVGSGTIYVATTATLYLSAYASFGVNTCSAYGYLLARKVG